MTTLADGFGYARPSTIEEALALMGESGAMVLAGGQTLIPRLSSGRAAPRVLAPNRTAVVEGEVVTHLHLKAFPVRTGSSVSDVALRQTSRALGPFPPPTLLRLIHSASQSSH